jgi:hypothetical protein
MPRRSTARRVAVPKSSVCGRQHIPLLLQIMGRLAANRVIPAHNPLATTPQVRFTMQCL